MKKWMTKTDAVILILLLLLSGSILFWQQQKSKAETDLLAVVTVDGKEEMQIPLSPTAKEQEFLLSNGVKLRVEKQSICFLESPCTNKVCIETGTLSKAGDVAACVPTKTVVTIQSQTTEDVDVITY